MQPLLNLPTVRTWYASISIVAVVSFLAVADNDQPAVPATTKTTQTQIKPVAGPVASDHPVRMRKQMYIPLQNRPSSAAGTISTKAPDRRVRLAAKPTSSSTSRTLKPGLPGVNPNGQDDLLIGNPYHKGGKFKGTAGQTKTSTPPLSKTSPTVQGSASKTKSATPSSSATPRVQQPQPTARPAAPQRGTVPSSPNEETTETPQAPAQSLTQPTNSAGQSTTKSPQPTPLSQPVNPAAPIRTQPSPASNRLPVVSDGSGQADDLLIGNPHHQNGKFRGNAATQQPVQQQAPPKLPVEDTNPSVPNRVPKKSQSNTQYPGPFDKPVEQILDDANSIDGNASPPTMRPHLPVQGDQSPGDELLQGNPYHETTPTPPRNRVDVQRPNQSLTDAQKKAANQSVIEQLNQNANIGTGAAQTNISDFHQHGSSHGSIHRSPHGSNHGSPHGSTHGSGTLDGTSKMTSVGSGNTTPTTDPSAEESDDDDLFGDLYTSIEKDSEEKDEDPDRAAVNDEADQEPYVDPHLELYSKEMYPSAKQCAKCHEQVYKEWAVSSHAYASVSPMFNRFEHKINTLAQGTLGYFCLRCHAPVASAMNIPRDEPLVESIPAAYEGVTCISCHRVSERYTRVNGERLVEPGSIFNPVYGASDGSGLDEVLANSSHYKVKTSPDETGPGQDIHGGAVFFDQLSKSEFCVSCHQVAVFPGIKLEVVWEQYRASPACKDGISCQDCHMGKVPGKPLGYATAPGAVVGGKAVNPNRKHSNHMFFGPGYSVAHPGIFPFNMKADEYDWKPQDWLQFDYRAGWGSERFEEMVDNGQIAEHEFPAIWADADDRRDAWDIVKENMETMAMEKQARSQLMEGSSHIDGPFFDSRPRCGKALKFHYDVSNLNSGHNAPSGSLGAQPQIWVNAALVNPRGERVWESGYTDSLGDVADTLSLEVAAGRCKPDYQLVNFQAKFLFTHVKGTDREWFLPVNVDFDQLPFIRPSGFPVTTMNHPPFIRMEQRSLPPLSTRKAKYKVPAEAMRVPGKYRLSVRMRSRSHPIYFVRFCDGTPDMERRINEGMLDFHQDTVEFIVH